MNIAIIGTGSIGSALAAAWAPKHTIRLGVRDTSNFKGMHLLDLAKVSAHSAADAVRESDVVLVSIPPAAAAAVIPSLGDLHSKIVIDATNSVFVKPEPHATVFHALLAAGAVDLVKCFNSTGVENMRDPHYADTAADMFMAGDSPHAKEVAKQLALDCGFAACYDFGGSDTVLLLEQFAMTWINLAIKQGMGRNIAFKLLQR